LLVAYFDDCYFLFVVPHIALSYVLSRRSLQIYSILQSSQSLLKRQNVFKEIFLL